MMANTNDDTYISFNSAEGRGLGLEFGEYLQRSNTGIFWLQGGDLTSESGSDDQVGIDDMSEAVEDEDGTIVLIEEEGIPIDDTVLPYFHSNNTDGFAGLSNILLGIIFEYATLLPSDTLHIERVCKKFYEVLCDTSDFWNTHILFTRCESLNFISPNVVLSTRDKAFISQGLKLMKKSMSTGDNAIVSVIKKCNITDDDDSFSSEQMEMPSVSNQLEETMINEGMDLEEEDHDDEEEQFEMSEASQKDYTRSNATAQVFQSIALKIICKMANGGIVSPFRLRGDTIGYLVEILEGCVIRKLECALMVAINRNEGYPEVTSGDINIVDRMSYFNHNRTPRCCVGTNQHGNFSQNQSSSCFCTSISNTTNWRWPDDDCRVEEILTSEARLKIIRKIAYKAGVLKMTDEAFAVVEAELLHLLGILLVDAYESTTNAPITELRIIDEVDREINEIEMFSIPPPLFHIQNDNNDVNDSECVYTIVPGHIKNSLLRRYFSPCHVYGDTWIPSPGFTAETEKRIEKSYYYTNNNFEYVISGYESYGEYEHYNIDYDYENSDESFTDDEADTSSLESIIDEIDGDYHDHDHDHDDNDRNNNENDMEVDLVGVQIGDADADVQPNL